LAADGLHSIRGIIADGLGALSLLEVATQSMSQSLQNIAGFETLAQLPVDEEFIPIRQEPRFVI
jgi:hypothetical protein